MGQDPVWGITSNKLNFSNGVKMKLGVIMAVLHMSIGIVQKGTNSIYFKKYWDFGTEVVVGLIILWGLFGWMDFLVISKWFMRIDIEDTADAPDTPNNKLFYDTDDEALKASGGNAISKYAGDVTNQNTPSIIAIMITQVFAFGDYEKTDPNDLMRPVVGKTNKDMYSIGLALLAIVIVVIPIMLCTKPIYFGCCGPDHDEDRDEIEFTNINRGDNDMQQPLQPGIQRISEDGDGDNSKRITDDMMLKRQREMQSLDAQLRAMGAKEEQHDFGELFIH